jgi:hypothetical protein
MSKSLTAERREEEVRQLFYPGQASRPINPSTKRNPKFLVAFDAHAYWDVYERILRTPALRFPDVHRLTDLSYSQGRVLFQVMDHVVNWLNPNRTVIADRRDNKKPPLRDDILSALPPFSAKRVRQAERRPKAFNPDVTYRSSREGVSVLLQQEVLEFVLDHLAAFKGRTVKAYLEPSASGPNGEGYADRFREKTWRGVLDIVRWYVGTDFRPDWLPTEAGRDEEPGSERSKQAVNLTDAFCNYARGIPGFSENAILCRKLESLAFRNALAKWFSEQCHEELQTGEDGEGRDGQCLSGRAGEPAATTTTTTTTTPGRAEADGGQRDSPDREQEQRATEGTARDATQTEGNAGETIQRSPVRGPHGGATGTTTSAEKKKAERPVRRPLPTSTREGQHNAAGITTPGIEAISQQQARRAETSPVLRTPRTSRMSLSEVVNLTNRTPSKAAWREGYRAAR